MNPSTASAMFAPDHRRPRTLARDAARRPFRERMRARMRNVVFHLRLLTYKP
jgi:hypothetical protein